MKPFSTVIDTIRRLADEHPDQVADSKYFYEHDDSPCCIIGHVFAAFGARPMVRPDSERHAVCGDQGDHVVDEGDGIYMVDWNALGIQGPAGPEYEWAHGVQADQDAGTRWGDAVRNADAGVVAA